MCGKLAFDRSALGATRGSIAGAGISPPRSRRPLAGVSPAGTSSSEVGDRIGLKMRGPAAPTGGIPIAREIVCSAEAPEEGARVYRGVVELSTPGFTVSPLEVTG